MPGWEPSHAQDGSVYILSAQNTGPGDLEAQAAHHHPLFGGSATPRGGRREPHPPRQRARTAALLVAGYGGAQYASSEKLFEAEEAIWGSAEKQGRVALRILEQKAGEFVRPSDLVGDRGAAKTGPMERFFLHPFNFNKKENLPEASGLKWVEFTLELIPHLSEEEKEHLRRAIRAWIAFGGIGARTRRGVGALEVLNEPQAWLPASPEQLRAWFAQPLWRTPRTPPWPVRWFAWASPASPAIPTPSRATPPGAKLGRFWARLRKGHFVKDPRTGETMAYTPMAGGKWNDHKTLLTLGSKQQEIALAKPYLGLPIVYQRLGNSFSGTLDAKHPQGRRMASPVILKPMAFADGSVRPAVVLLKAPCLSASRLAAGSLPFISPRPTPC